LVSRGLETGDAAISYQVVQEALNVLTRKLATPVAPDDGRRFLDRVLAPLWRVMPSLALYHRGLDIQARYRYSLYDALIIAAALDAGCARLYSARKPGVRSRPSERRARRTQYGAGF
jgi:predicted nucleic acid-binding protein